MFQDTILYGAALSSLEKAGQWQLSWHLLVRLPQLQLSLSPGVETFP